MSNINRDLNKLDPKFKFYALQIWELVNYHRLPFRVFETVRSIDRQKVLVKRGYSKTLKSKHIEGKAADFVVFIDGKWTWESKYLYYYNALGGIVEEKLGDFVTWGGSWSWYDGPHYELKE